MSRLKLQMQLTVDGFVANGPNDDVAWNEIEPYCRDLLDSADTIVLGRKTAVEFIPYWATAATRHDDPWCEVAKRIAGAKKVVFSRTLERSEWDNTYIEKGDIVDKIQRLKDTNKKDIIVYGGISFVSALIKKRLIEEFHLFVNPIALGAGGRVFDGIGASQRLKLLESIAYNSGLVLLSYELRA